MSSLDRRNFLRVSGAAAATLSSGALSQVKGANERVNVAVIGVRGRGREHIEKFALDPSPEVVAVVDIDQAVAETAAAQTQKFQSRKPKEYADLRKMLEQERVDAIHVSTGSYFPHPRNPAGELPIEELRKTYDTLI